MAGALIAAVVLAAIAWTLLGPFRTQGVARMAPPAAPVQAPVGAVPPAILPAAIPTPAPATAVMPPAPAAAAPAGNNSARAGEPVAALATRRADGPVPASSTPSAELPLPADGAGMPKLTITGGVYSDAPGQRMLIVNGQVLNEGSEAAPGVVLEQIRPRTAVLGFRGQRYVVNY